MNREIVFFSMTFAWFGFFIFNYWALYVLGRGRQAFAYIQILVRLQGQLFVYVKFYRKKYSMFAFDGYGFCRFFSPGPE